MFSVSILRGEAGVVVSGVADGDQLSVEDGALAIRAVPNGQGAPAADVAAVAFELRDGAGALIAAETVDQPPFILGELPVLADGDYTLSLTALDAAGAPLAPAEDTAFALNSSPEFQTIRIQGEDTVDTGDGVFVLLGNDGVGTENAPIVTTPGADEQGSQADYLDWPSNGDDAGSSAEFNFEVPADGEYVVAIRYALSNTNADDGNRPLALAVNGAELDPSFDFVQTVIDADDPGDTFGNYELVTVRLDLQAGANSVRFTSLGKSGPNIDWLEVRQEADAFDPIIVQMEDVALSGNNAAITANTISPNDDLRAGFSGDKTDLADEGYADFGSTPGSAATTTIEAPMAGLYRVAFRFAASSARPLDLDIDQGADGGVDQTVRYSFPASPGADDDQWTNWTFLANTVQLAAGANMLSLRIPEGFSSGPNIDMMRVDLVAADPAAPTAITLNNDSVIAGQLGAVIGAVSVADLDDTAHSFTVTENGVPSSDFEVSNGVLKLAQGVALDLADGFSRDIAVTAIDGDEQSVTETFTIFVGAGASEDSGVPNDFNQVYQVEDVALITDVGGENMAARFAGDPETWEPDQSLEGLVDGVRPDATGGGYVDFGLDAGDEMALTVNVPFAGVYDMHIRYANGGGGDRPLSVTVGDAAPVTAAFPTTDDWGAWAVEIISVTLPAGEDVPVSFLVTPISTTGPNIDAIALTAPGGAPVFAVNAAPEFDPATPSEITVDENTVEVIDLAATDAEGDALTFALTGADAGLFDIDAATGEIAFASAPDAETPADADGDGVYELTATVSDGSSVTEQAISVQVGDVNEAIDIVESAFEIEAGQTAVGLVTLTDEDGETDELSAPSFAITGGADQALFAVDSGSGALSFLVEPTFNDAGANLYEVEVTATDGALSDAQTIQVTVTEPAAQGPVTLSFDTATIAGYSSQDAANTAPGFEVSGDQSALSLTDNVWKRAPLPGAFAISEGALLTVDLILSGVSEIVAIGVDPDENPFDTDGVSFKLAGSQGVQNFANFVDLSGTGVASPDLPGATRFVIDLSALAGRSIDSLVFINDDDNTGNGLGAATFANVTLSLSEDGGNAAPRVIAPIGDFAAVQGEAVELAAPFADDDGDDLTYTVTVLDAGGLPAAGFEGLTVIDGDLVGVIPGVAPGAYTISITASDGSAQTTTSFVLTVEDQNDAPIADQDAPIEPLFGAVGDAFSIDLSEFAFLFDDPEDQPLSLSVEGLPEGLRVEEGFIVGTPTQGGEFALTLRATDPGGLSATVSLPLSVEAPGVGDIVSVEAEDFTGLAEAENVASSVEPDASGASLISVGSGETGSISTQLLDNGVPAGWYAVTAVVFDETDGAGSLSLSIDGAALEARDQGSDTLTSSVLFNDDFGVFLNPGAARGTGGQPGNLKAIAFETVVFIEASSVLTLDVAAEGGEFMRVDRLLFERVEEPSNAAPTIAGLPAALDLPEGETLIASLTIADADSPAVTVTLSGADAALFSFNAITGELSFLGAPDFETPADADLDGVYEVTVDAADEENVASASVSVTVTDVNEALSFAQTGFAIDENETAAAALSLLDEDGAAIAANSFAITGGADAALFEIDATTGALSFSAAPDFEAPGDADLDNVYEVEVTAAAGELAAVETISISIGDDPELPFEPLFLQAESAALTLLDDGSNENVTAVRDADNPETSGLRPDFTGTGYLDFGDTPGDAATFTLPEIEPGTYDLSIRYASSGLRTLDVAVNGGAPVTIEFPDTGVDGGDGFDNWGYVTIPVTLTEGAGDIVSLAISPGAGSGPNLDRLEITELGAGPTNDLTSDDAPVISLVALDAELTPEEAATAQFRATGVDADIETLTLSLDGGVTAIAPISVVDEGDGAFLFTLDLSALPEGGGALTLTVADGGGNTPASTSGVFSISDGEVSLEPFTIQGEDPVAVTVFDGTVDGQGAETRVVSQAAPDDFGNFRVGAVGDAYMDMGGQAGDAFEISVDAPVAGLYTVAFRYANGGAADRPLTLSVNGAAAQLQSFPVTEGEEPWEAWSFSTVQLQLEAGANTLRLAVPAGATGGPNIDQITFTPPNEDGPVAFSQQYEAEAFQVITDLDDDIQVRDPSNPETNAETGPDGLWDGFTGTGYLDLGSDTGDVVGFTTSVPAAGVYSLTIRYSNGGGDGADRPLNVAVDGVTVATPAFASTGLNDWENWTEVVLQVELQEGDNLITFENADGNGPNIDHVVVSNDVPPFVEPGPRETIRINFQDGDLPVAAGYLIDNFEGFGQRDNGLSYGWVTEASATDADGTQNTPINGADYPAIAINVRSGSGADGSIDEARDFDSYDPRLTGYAHFDLSSYPGDQDDPNFRVAWEMAVDNGWYEVTVAVGDTGGVNDSDNQLLVEGALASSFVPTNFYKTELKTVLAKVEDGFLTLAAPDGVITEIQYLEVRALPDLTPEDENEAPTDYASFINPVAIAGIGEDSTEIDLNPESGPVLDVDPTSDLILGISVAPNRGGALLESLNDGSIQLFETLTGQSVPYSVNTTGGFDSLTISPLGTLKEFTSYTLVIDGFQDRGDNDDITAPTREFQKFSTTFTTTAAPEVVAREVAFVETIELDGAADGAFVYTSLELSPDGQHLYAGTLSGQLKRWDVDAVDGSLSNEQTLSLDHLQDDAGARGVIGIAFDPSDPSSLWITDNYPVPLSGRDNGVPDFSGRLSKLTIGEGEAFTATAETYITGFPRSNGDHVTNSIEFRANPNAGAEGEPEYLLYVIQGSNSAMGEADSAWGFRPERLLNAAVLEIDPTREAPEGGFDVSTEPLPADGLNRRFADTDNDLKNGGIAIDSGPFTGAFLHFDENGVASVRSGEDASSALIEEFYNPSADDAVLRIFATGQRNAYDLVWHSNGFLYTPTNGSAAGGSVPDNPDTPADESIDGVERQDDYFFKISEGTFSGHPNPLHDQYILNGGNPTSGTDVNQVGNYPAGTQPEDEYDPNNAYSLGPNRSPNGAIEYTSDVFGSSLQGAVIFTEYSSGNDLRAIILDANGDPIDDFIVRDPDGNVISHPDPLDVVQDAFGRLYLLTLNRSNGESQLVRLDPAPGGVVADTSADQGGDLALVVVDASDPAAVLLQVNGLDADIVDLSISFDGGATALPVTLDAQNRFTADLSGVTEAVTAVLTVEDDNANTASAEASFTPGEAPTELVSLIVIQAEDATPFDGTSVTVPNDVDAEIEIRSASNTEYDPTDPRYNGEGLTNGLRDGAFGTDGNTDYLDGVPGGYADFGGTNADFLTFNFDVAAESAGNAVLRLRFANGAAEDRPLALSVNGGAAQVLTFTASSLDGEPARWSDWRILEVPANLIEGTNTVTLTSIADTGPNIDQLEVLVDGSPNDGTEVVEGVTYLIYEAENADFGEAAFVSGAADPRNASGEGFVDYDGPGDETVTWTVFAAQAGTYGVDVLYSLAAAKEDRPLSMVVNGDVAGAQSVNFPGFAGEAEDSWAPLSLTLALNAGANTIAFTAPAGVGPNLDYLRVTQQPIDDFQADFVDVDGETRIELEQTADNSTRVLNEFAVDFFFSPSESGLHQLQLAANPSAPDGAGLRLLLNGEEIADLDFPGAGDAGEVAVFVELEAGEEYALRVISDAAGANAIDYLDIAPAIGDANAQIAIESGDAAFLSNRLHFSYHEDPTGGGQYSERDFKDSGVVTISNTGSAPLSMIDATIDGPFVLADPSVLEGLTLGAGESLDLTVLFDRAAYTPPTSNIDGTSTIFTGAVTLVTNDLDDPISTIDLAGFWQARPEGGQEPNVNEVWSVFGFGNVIEGLSLNGGGENSVLSTNDVFAATDETEVLSPYWRLADGFSEAKITQIAAFHGVGGATIGIHNPGNKGDGPNFWNHEGTDNQRLLPNANGGFATESFGNGDIPDGWVGDEVFGIKVANLSTDPTLNPTGDVLVDTAGVEYDKVFDNNGQYTGFVTGPGDVVFDENDLDLVQQGHTVKIFQALDANGVPIPNTYLGVMDYTGINYDYNDNLFVIEGVEPVGLGQSIAVAGLDDAAADDRLVFSRIDNPANAEQEFRDLAEFEIVNDGFLTLTLGEIAVAGADAGAFQIVSGPAEGSTLAPGASATVTVAYVGSDTVDDNAAVLHQAALTVASDDISQPLTSIALAGLAQIQSEGGEEPTVEQIAAAFGYSTDMAQGQLANGGLVETVGDEVLAPYLTALDASAPVEVIQLAAYLQQGDVARLGVHGLSGGAVSELFAQDDQQGQTVLPDGLVSGAGNTGAVASDSFFASAPFGLKISVDGRPTYASWSDPEANERDPDIGGLVDDGDGHLIRYFQAKDASGADIPGVLIAIQDYPGAGNYDYNDHMFVIKNVAPYALDAATDANANGVNDALETDTDGDGLADFFDNEDTPPIDEQTAFGGTPASFTEGVLQMDADAFDEGGQGVAYNDVEPGSDGGTGYRSDTDVDFVGAETDIGFISNGEWLEYTVDVPEAGAYSFAVVAKSPTPGAVIGLSVEDGPTLASVALPDANPGGNGFGGTEFGPAGPVELQLQAGVQTLRLTMTGPAADNGYVMDLRSFSLTKEADVVTPPPGEQAPFGGTPASFTEGVLQMDADAFDEGGQGVAYNDVEPGSDGGTGYRGDTDVDFVGAETDIGFISNGEWLEYTVDVPEAGAYSFAVVAKSPTPGAVIGLSVEDGPTLASVALPDANPGGNGFGGTEFGPAGPVELQLQAGVQTLRLTMTGPAADNGYVMDLRSFSLTKEEDVVTPPPVDGQTPFNATGTPWLLDSDGLTLQGVQYDEGGPGVSFNDSNAGLEGGNDGGHAGTDVEVTAGGAIGWIANGEWLEYTIDVAEAGEYSLTFLSSRGNTSTVQRTITASFDAGAGVYEQGQTTVAPTGSWTNFVETPSMTLDLEAGEQVLRVLFNGGNQDLLSFTFEQVNADAGGGSGDDAGDGGGDGAGDGGGDGAGDGGGDGAGDGGGVVAPAFSLDSLVFDGGIGSAQIVGHAGLFAAENGAIEVLFETNGLGGRQTLFSKDASGFAAGGHIGAYVIDDDIEVRVQSANASFSVTAQNVVDANVEQRMVVSFGDGGLELWLGGELIDTSAFTGGLELNQEDWVLGANQWASQPGQTTPLSHAFDGEIGEFNFYDEALDDAAIAALFDDAVL